MRILTFTSLLLSGTVGLAGQCCPSNCCPPPVCEPACSVPAQQLSCCGSTSNAGISYASGPTTKLFKGKDGTIREVITHWEALHRVVEAESLEADLAAVRTELDSASTELEAAKTELAALKQQSATQVAALQKELSALKKKMGQQSKIASNQKVRADKAEAVGAKAAKQAQQNLAKLEGTLKQTAEERDSLKTANQKLKKRAEKMAAARTKAEEEIAATKAQLKKMKQEAIESKKTQVAKSEEEAPVESSDAPAEEPKEEDAPTTDENNLRISLQ